MNFTKEHLLTLVNQQNTDFFYDLCYNGDIDAALETLSNVIPELSELDDYVIDNINYKQVYDLNLGDGNDMVHVYAFTFENESEPVYVKCDGWYSSWDSSEYNNVCIAEPYDYTEVRYRKITN